jgi:tRNA (guanine37-N1)-methyltransferase
VDEELSIGDYVVSGGEVPAMVLVEGLVRLLPGVLGNPASVQTESFQGTGVLEGPQYTRPPVYRGTIVPEVLRSGDHGLIEEWRRKQALRTTRDRRPDLLATPCPDDEQNE